MRTMQQLHETPFHFFIKSLKAFRFSAVLTLTGRAFQIFSTKRNLVSSRIIQIQLISVASDSIFIPLFKYFFHETGISVVKCFVYFNTEESELAYVHIPFT